MSNSDLFHKSCEFSFSRLIANVVESNRSNRYPMLAYYLS